MTITITIQAETGDEARVKLQSLLGTTALPPAKVEYGTPGQRVEDPAETTNSQIVAADRAPDIEAPTRERGKPSQGRARRTKEEIAEDEAAEKAEATTGQTNISSGAEDRIDPENPEVEAQDKADEQAEVATTASSTLNHDDIRAVLGKYVKAYGIDAAQEDGPKLISLVCGEGKSKVSDVPDDLIAKVVAGVEEMLTKNPYKRAADL